MKQQPDYYDHPVLDPKGVFLDTPALNKLRNDVHRWLWNGVTGGMIYGNSRVGKSWTMEKLETQIYTRGKVKVPTHFVSMPDTDQDSIRSVHENLCLSANLRVARRDNGNALRDRFTHYILDRVAEAGCRYAVLIVDEMQVLAPSQFNAFTKIYNDLSRLGITFMVLFIGNDPDCWDLVELFNKNKRYASIRGRFFTQGSAFYGLRSVKEVKHCLAQYDLLRYPEGGPTYVAFFLEDAAEKGWKLRSLSQSIWGVFREFKTQYKIESWGMQYFRAAITILLTDFLPKYGVDAYDDAMMRACIESSGLLPSLARGG